MYGATRQGAYAADGAAGNRQGGGASTSGEELGRMVCFALLRQSRAKFCIGQCSTRLVCHFRSHFHQKAENDGVNHAATTID